MSRYTVIARNETSYVAFETDDPFELMKWAMRICPDERDSAQLAVIRYVPLGGGGGGRNAIIAGPGAPRVQRPSGLMFEEAAKPEPMRPVVKSALDRLRGVNLTKAEAAALRAAADIGQRL